MADIDTRRISALRSIAAHLSWARTPDRTERTEPARRNSPTRIEYWEKRVREERKVRPQDVAKAAANYHSAYMRELSLKAAAGRAKKKTSTR